MKQLKRLKTASGSVLLTVVMVMFIMVMFLMSTLVLTNSANRRSYYTYFQTQAQYAAQAALDSVTNNAYSSKEFYDYVDKLEGKTDTFRVYFENNDMPLKKAEDGRKYVECTISPVDEPNYVWDKKTGKLYEQPGWKITAVAEVGTGKNTAQKSVVNYIYSTVVDKDAIEAPKNEWDYTYNSSVSQKDEIIKKTKKNPGTVEVGTEAALIQLGEDPTGSANDNMDSIGGNILGANLIPAGRTRYQTNWKRTIANDSVQAGDWTLVNNSSFGDCRTFFSAGANKGIRMFADINFVMTEYAFYSTASVNDVSEYRSMPYFFVEGKVEGAYANFGTGSQLRKVKGASTEGVAPVPNTTPIVVHLGALDNTYNTRKLGLKGDLYLHDPALTSVIKADGGSYFLTFTSNQIKKDNATNSNCVNGNFVCNNSSLTLTGEYNLHGDFLFTNPEGTLQLNGAKLNIDGAFVTAANVTGSGEINAKGGVFALDSKSIAPNTKSNETDGYNVLTSAKIDSIGFNDSATDAGSLVTMIKENRDGYPEDYEDNLDDAPDYSLFPYYARLDEISDEYVRWDMTGEGGQEGHGFGYDKTGAFDGTKDDLMKESIAAGHSYQYVKKSGNLTNEANGKVIEEGGKPKVFNLTFPATHPNSAVYTNGNLTTRGKNAFIPEYSPCAEVTNKSPSSLQEVKDAYADKRTIDITNIKDVDNAQSVKVFGHDSEGTDQTMNLTASVVNTSGVYRLKGGQANYVFIDPYTAENATSEKPMVVAFCGGQDAQQIEFVVNNSARYDKGYSNPFPFAANGDYSGARPDSADSEGTDCETSYKNEHMTVPSRKDVIIYFMNEGSWDKQISSKMIDLYPSGAYYQIKNGPIAFTVNVVYPDGTDKDTWNAITDNDKKYKYEMMPNCILHLPAGDFGFQSGGDERRSEIWAAVLASETNVRFDADTKGRPDNEFQYRVDLDEEEPVYLNGDYAIKDKDKAIGLVGSLMCKSCAFANWRTIVYAGPVTTSSGDTEEEDDILKHTATYDEKKDGDETLGDNVGGKYFGNDHMGDN
jgi:hypothetical protein